MHAVAVADLDLDVESMPIALCLTATSARARWTSRGAVMRIGALAVCACSSSANPPASWFTDEAAALTRANLEHKALVVNFTETWSIPSVKLSHLLDTPEIWVTLTADFVPLRIDISNQDESSDVWRARYGHPNLPAVLFVNQNGAVLARIDSFPDEAALRLMIATAAAKRAK